MCSSLGPRSVHALQGPPERGRAHVSARIDAQRDVIPTAHARLQHRGNGNFGVPARAHKRQQLQRGLARVAAPVHVAQVRQPPRLHGLHAVRGAKDGQREGCVGQTVAATAHDVHTHVRLLAVAPLGLEDQRQQLRAAHVGLQNRRADAALQTRGLRGFRSVFFLWQSTQSACSCCTLSAKSCRTGTTWSSSQALCVTVQPHSAHKPCCTARTSCRCAAVGTSRLAFSNLRKTSCARPASRWPRYSWSNPSHQRRSSSCSWAAHVPGPHLRPQPSCTQGTAEG